jgi:hypothetical protein
MSMVDEEKREDDTQEDDTQEDELQEEDGATGYDYSGSGKSIKERVGDAISNIRDKIMPSRKYSYTAPGTANAIKSSWEKYGRSISIALVSIFTLFMFFNLSTNVTGFITYTESLQEELNETQIELAGAKASHQQCISSLDGRITELTECNSLLSGGESELAACKSEKTSLTIYTDELNEVLNVCTSERDIIQESLDTQETNYDELIRNSARPMCCSAFSILNGDSISWGLNDNKLKCGSGDFTVDCSTGETDY